MPKAPRSSTPMTGCIEAVNKSDKQVSCFALFIFSFLLSPLSQKLHADDQRNRNEDTTGVSNSVSILFGGQLTKASILGLKSNRTTPGTQSQRVGLLSTLDIQNGSFAIYGKSLLVGGNSSHSELKSENEGGREKQSDEINLHPDRNFFISFNPCENLSCKIALGRLSIPNEDEEILYAGHTGLSGLHLEFAAPGVITLHMALAPNQNVNETSLTRSLAYPWEDLRYTTWTSKHPMNSTLQTDLLLTYGYFRFASFYGRRTQPETAHHKDSQYNQTDVFEYGGLGLGFVYEEEFTARFLISYDRSMGAFKTNHKTSAGNFEESIKGSAVHAGMDFEYQWFSFSLKTFLAEPSTTNRGSIAKNDERTGFILLARKPLPTSLLSGVLDIVPAPVPCPNRESCVGIQRNSSDSMFREQAGVVQVALGFDWDEFEATTRATYFRELVKKDSASQNPFRNLKRDESKAIFDEYEILISYATPNGRFDVAYSRLLKRLPSGKRITFAEYLGVALGFAI